jgi:glycine hydroxymethyltransferase
LALRGLGPDVMPRCAGLVHRVLAAARPRGDRDYDLPATVRDEVRSAVRALCDAYPIPSYPLSVAQARSAAAPR